MIDQAGEYYAMSKIAAVEELRSNPLADPDDIFRKWGINPDLLTQSEIAELNIMLGNAGQIKIDLQA